MSAQQAKHGIVPILIYYNLYSYTPYQVAVLNL